MRRQASAWSTCSQTTVWRAIAARIRGERTLPPPSAIAPPSSAPSSNEPTTSASRSRKPSSPWFSNACGIVEPKLASISSSISTVESPSPRAAASAVDLPAPMKPTKTIDDFIAPRPRSPRVDARLVGVDRGADVVDVVAAELLAVGTRQGQADHRLGDPRGGGNDGRVGPLAQRLRGLVGDGVDRAQRLGQGRDRL